jgi:hypothetical protein
VLPSAERDDRAVVLAHAQALIGRSGYEHGMQRGASMNDDQAATYALDQLDAIETQELTPDRGS